MFSDMTDNIAYIATLILFLSEWGAEMLYPGVLRLGLRDNAARPPKTQA